jgi:hypothetical protein
VISFWKCFDQACKSNIWPGNVAIHGMIKYFKAKEETQKWTRPLNKSSDLNRDRTGIHNSVRKDRDNWQKSSDRTRFGSKTETSISLWKATVEVGFNSIFLTREWIKSRKAYNPARKSRRLWKQAFQDSFREYCRSRILCKKESQKKPGFTSGSSQSDQTTVTDQKAPRLARVRLRKEHISQELVRKQMWK